MPALKSIMDQGCWGKISTLDPPLSPMLWTSIATGFRADKHGILGFVEPKPDLSGVRPVTSTSRKVKAIWNILNQNNLKSNVVSWWPSNPVEPINGVMVSNFFQVAGTTRRKNWELLPGTIHPEELMDELKICRVHPSEITKFHILPFVPDFEKIDKKEQSHQKRISAIMKIIAEASSVHAASTFLQRKEWDFMAVYHDMIDHFSHLCMRFHPPQLPGIPDDYFEWYKEVVNGAYIFQDMMLERSLELCDEDTTVMILSDHGFHSDHLRPIRLPKEPAAPAREHSPFGIFCIKGPGIKKGHRITNASVIDITPTLLHLYDLPIGKDMEGKVLISCLENQKPPVFIDSWETVPGESGQHSDSEKIDPWAGKEAMEQLIQLGYVEPPDAKIENTLERISNESQYYLARNLIHANKFQEGINVLEPLFESTSETRFGQRLAYCYLSLRQFAKCRILIDRLREIIKENKDNQKFINETSEEERLRWRDPEVELPFYLDLLEGMLFISTHQTKKAVIKLKTLADQASNAAEVYYFLGRAYMQNQKWDLAGEMFIKCLSIDDEHAQSFYQLGLSFLRRGQLEEAIDHILRAIELNYFLSNAHYHLGEALTQSNEIHAAKQAFEVAVKLQPGMSKAYKWLIYLCREKLAESELADRYEAFLKNNIKGEIIIVSGLPRSGTSMIMQMLEAAGSIPILFDEVRQADENNPKGYYEFAPIRRLAKDKACLQLALGKAVKVYAQLLHHLPADYNYKIIFIDRNADEVLKSQQKVLGKQKHLQENAFPLGLDQTLKKQIEKVQTWINVQPNIQILELEYEQVIKDPIDNATLISSFLGETLNPVEMSKVINQQIQSV